VVVTHDDRYFHVADRVLQMDYGKLSDLPATLMKGSPRKRAVRRPNKPASQEPT
jgi:ABC-type siderophore export system fused ATPase/permease subunit